MFLNLGSITIQFGEVRPVERKSYYRTAFVDPKTKIITEIHFGWLLILAIFIIDVQIFCQLYLKIAASVVIHEEEQTDNGTEKTTDVRNHSIELDKSTDIVMFSCCFSEPEARVPSISHFLRGNRVGSRDNSSVFLHIISIWQNTVIRLNVILRNEDLM